MPLKKTHKRKKSSRNKGRKTIGYGARKKHKHSGHKGGKGMSGSGKRADHKKSLVIKLYGNNYFGRKGVTSRKTAKKKNNVLNVRDIDRLLEKNENKKQLNLENFKILGEGNIEKNIKNLIIKVKSASKTAKEKIEKAGGKLELTNEKKEKKNIKKSEEDKKNIKEES